MRDQRVKTIGWPKRPAMAGKATIFLMLVQLLVPAAALATGGALVFAGPLAEGRSLSSLLATASEIRLEFDPNITADLPESRTVMVSNTVRVLKRTFERAAPVALAAIAPSPPSAPPTVAEIGQVPALYEIAAVPEMEPAPVAAAVNTPAASIVATNDLVRAVATNLPRLSVLHPVELALAAIPDMVNDAAAPATAVPAPVEAPIETATVVIPAVETIATLAMAAPAEIVAQLDANPATAATNDAMPNLPAMAPAAETPVVASVPPPVVLAKAEAAPMVPVAIPAQPTPIPASATPTIDDSAPAIDFAAAPVATSGPAQTPESLRDAIVDALKGNPEIQIALARQDDAKYGVNEARSAYMPHLDLTVGMGAELNAPNAGDTTKLRRTEGMVALRQNVWDFGATINDIKRARAAYRSAQWSTRERIEAIAFEITTAYLNVLERQKLLDLATNEVAAHQKILKMVSVQSDLGLTTPADVSRAKARLENVQASLLDRGSALQQARESYRRLVDRLPGKTIDLPSPASSLPVSADAAVAMIDDHSPRMAQAVEDRRSLDRQRASQTGTFFPRVGLEVQGNWKDDVQGKTGTNRDARAMVTLSYRFFNGGADIAVRNRISARLREADYELARRRREVEQDIRIDFNALEAARNKMASIDSEIQSAERVVELYRAQFREGRRSVFDLLDSQQLLFTARSNQLTNNTAKLVSEFRVLQKLGGLFDLVSNGEPLPPLVMPAPGSKK